MKISLSFSNIFQKQKQMLRNILILFGNTRGTYVKYLKAIATQRKQNLPTSLWKVRTEVFNLAVELKSFIALNILNFDIIVDIIDCLKEGLDLSFLKDTDLLTVTSNSNSALKVTYVILNLLLNAFDQRYLQFWEAPLSQNFHIFCIVPSVILFIVRGCLRQKTWLLFVSVNCCFSPVLCVFIDTAIFLEEHVQSKF